MLVETVGEAVSLRPGKVILSETELASAFVCTVQSDLLTVLARRVMSSQLGVETSAHFFDLSRFDWFINLLVHLFLGALPCHSLLLCRDLALLGKERLHVCHFIAFLFFKSFNISLKIRSSSSNVHHCADLGKVVHAHPIYPITRYFPLSAPKFAAPELAFCVFGLKRESGHPPASTDTHHTGIGWRPRNTKTTQSCNSYAQ